MDDRPTAGQASRQLATALVGALTLTLLAAPPVWASAALYSAWAPPGATLADFRGEVASADARAMADWIIRSGDNRGGPFIIVDKKAARVFVFDGRAHLRGAATALLGLARGDESAPDIGERKLSQIRPEERTTPAGRFVASLGVNLAGQELLWVDYKTALALHRVVTTDKSQRRLERLAPHSRLSRRITFGCINVPVDFYDHVVRPQFRGSRGVVYILPETKSIREVFFRQSARR